MYPVFFFNGQGQVPLVDLPFQQWAFLSLRTFTLLSLSQRR